jgi:hypothetical protein
LPEAVIGNRESYAESAGFQSDHPGKRVGQDEGNPNRFDIDGYLALGPNEITWLVRQYGGEIKPGDVVYIWRSSGGSTDKAGIIARATVLTEPANISDDPAAAPFWKRDVPSETSTRVKLRVDGIANSRECIRRDWLVDDPACSEMLIIRQPAGTNFPVEPQEAERLRNLWIKTGVDWSRAESLAALQTYLALYGKQISVQLTTERTGLGATTRTEQASTI